MKADLAKLGSVTSVEGSLIKIDCSDCFEVKNATVVASDIEADNGVIHMIDTVILIGQPEVKVKMKTVEFKLSLNQSQQAKVNEWLNVQRWVWNQGLQLLEEFDAFTAWDKDSKAWVPCCPVQWDYYKDDNGQLIPFTRLARVKPYRIACPIPQLYRQPQLKSRTFFGLGYYFAQKNHLDKPWFCQVPIKFVFGTLQSLANSWSEYKAGKRKRPRHKRYKDKIKTLIHNNAKRIKVSGRQITLPKLGRVTVKTLDKRWIESASISTLKIVKEPSGHYLQLTGELPTKKLNPSNKAVGLATGYPQIYTTDGGKIVQPSACCRKMEKRLARLQRKASRRQNGSANQQKVFQQIGRLHEKSRRSRRAFNHKLSTYVVREYGGIATAKAEIKKITRRPRPIMNREGRGYISNGATRKSQVNKNFLNSGLAQLTIMIEQKAKVAGREFIAIDCKDLPDEPRQLAEKYSNKLLLPRSVYLSSFYGRYRAWAWEQTPGESDSQETLNQEVSQETPPCDAGTTFEAQLLAHLRVRVGAPIVTSKH